MIFEQKPYIVDKKLNQDVDAQISTLLTSSHMYGTWLLWKMNLYKEEDDSVNWKLVYTV